MTALKGGIERAVGGFVEIHVEFLVNSADILRSLGDKHPDRVVIVFLAAGNECVLKMQVVGVVGRIEYGGDSALGKGGV